MYVNLSGAIHLLYNPQFKVEVVCDVWVPHNVVWLSLVNGKLLFICSPDKVSDAETIAELHNIIYDSPLAKAMRE